MTLLSVKNMTIDIENPHGTLHAVRGADLEVEQGTVLGVVGESGCGKSLCAMGILNLLPKTAIRRADSIKFMGRDITNATELEMRSLRGSMIGVVFQDPMTALNPTYTIGNQLAEAYMRHMKASRKEADERSLHLLDRVGITAAKSRLKQYPHQLSGGLRQRIVIAMALMCGPKLIVADEPTTALDATIQIQILWLIKQLQEETGAGVILITHDLGVIAQVADSVAVMYAGKVVETGTSEEVFLEPRHPYTKGLLACTPQADSERELGQVRGVVPSLVGRIEGCAFRNRCPLAAEACRETVPERRSDGHRWWCAAPTSGQSKSAKGAQQ